MILLAALSSLAVAGATASTSQRATSGYPAAPLRSLASAIDIPYATFTLQNGLRVVVHTDRKAPIVAVSVWYAVGSKHEPAGRTGFAHLFEHLMFNGSENAPGDFFAPLKEIGATDYNGTTYFDRTNYFETVPTGGLERALFLESDRMGHLLGAITQEVLDQQRGVVQNEKRQGDNRPYGLVQYAVSENLFPNGHPYGHTPIGSMGDLDAASLDTVKGWFRDHYAPNNAVLVLAGDIDEATARPLIEKYFGGIARGPASIAPPITAAPLKAASRVTLHDRVAQTLVVRDWVAPGLSDPDSAGLDVAASILGGLASSRLNEELVKRRRLFVQIDASNEARAQAGVFSITGMVRAGVAPEDARKGLEDALADFVRDGPDADEVNRAVATEVASEIGGLEAVGGTDGKAVVLAEGMLFANDPGFYKTRLSRLVAQTPASVAGVVRRWLAAPALDIDVLPGSRPTYQEAAGVGRIATVPTATPKAPMPARSMPPFTDRAALTFPQVTHARLTNGMEVAFARRATVPLTRMAVSFDAGTSADPDGRLGLGRLTVKMLDEGIPDLDSSGIARTRERLGADMSADVSADRTTVMLSTPSVNLGSATRLLASVLRTPLFPADALARVKEQQAATIEQELSSPDGAARRLLPALAVGTSSPYAKDQGSGSGQAVRAMTRAELITYQQAWLRPDKARIFVVSDRPLSAILPQLEAAFGGWTAAGSPGRKLFGREAAQVPQVVLVDRPDSPQSLIVGVGPNTLRGTDDLLAASVGNDALGGSFLGRLNMDLREKRHWTYGVRGDYLRFVFAAPYVVKTAVQADRTGESLKLLRDDVGAYVGDQPMSDAEFERAVTGAVRALPGRYESSEAVLETLQQNALYRRSDDYVASLPGRLRALTAEQARQATSETIRPAAFSWLIVGNAKVVATQLKDLDVPVRTMTPSP